MKILLDIFNIMAHPNQTLCGRDERILDPSFLELTPPQEEAAFNDWLQRHGYSSKEEYYHDCYIADLADNW